jgi:hypothetical protein
MEDFRQKYLVDPPNTPCGEPVQAFWDEYTDQVWAEEETLP